MINTLLSSTLFLILLFTNPAEPWKSKIDPILLEQGNSSTPQDFIILLEAQADLSPSKFIAQKEDKTRFVYQRLRQTAEKSQTNLLRLLKNEGRSTEALFIINVIRTQGDYSLLEKLAKRSDVKYIYSNPEVKLSFPEESSNLLSLRNSGPEWGLEQIGAPEVWEMGYRGAGIVVGGQDTGYDWQHPAIRQQYRGNQGGSVNHNYHWYDAIHQISPLRLDSINNCGLDLLEPCDDSNHGTHTMGTMVGDDGNGNQIGVAPEAQWVGVRNMEEGYGNPFSYTAGFQWFLAPTDLQGEFPNPDLAPDVIANSWYCPELEGCNASNRDMLEMAANNLRAAGVMVVVSAGNSGSDCYTINEMPSVFPSTFAIGASDIRDSIAAFSSRGPIYSLDSSQILIKPDISAPGVNVRSAIRFGQYKSYSGTSMAGPHVVGAVALILSANPALRGQIDTLESILRRTARPIFSSQDCGPFPGQQSPNVVYGYGILNVKAAVEEALRMKSTSTRNIQVQQLQVFPNPASTVLNFRGLALDQSKTLHIYNQLGQVVLHKKQEANWLDISSLKTGTYWIQVTEGLIIYSAKIVVLR